LGFNYRITDIQCALGVNQLNRIDDFIQRRKQIVSKYNDALEKIDGIVIPYQLDHVESSWHLYVIQLELEKMNADRKMVFDELRKNKIGVQIHYIPVYYHPYYQQLGYKKGLCPNAERLYERIISLPLYPKMDDTDVDLVIQTLTNIIESCKKE
jgi:dTDP-4-amino-4,6-dideoxygalactose transaminase